MITEDVAKVKKYTHAVRFLLEKDNTHFAKMLEFYSGSFDASVADSLACTSFDEYTSKKEIKVSILPNEELNHALFDTREKPQDYMNGGFFTPQIMICIPENQNVDISSRTKYDAEYNRVYLAYDRTKLHINQIGKEYFDGLFSCMIDSEIEYKKQDRLSL